MEWVFFAGFIVLILVVAVFAIRWAVAKQKALIAELANDPEYMAVPRGNLMWPTIRTRNASPVAEADLESIEWQESDMPRKMMVWRARVPAMGLARRVTFRLDKFGVPQGVTQSAGAAGGFPYGGFPSGNPSFDLLYMLKGTAAPLAGALVNAPAVRLALDGMNDRVRYVALGADDTLSVELTCNAVDAADAKRALGLVRTLAEALQRSAAAL
jgi:hypothetical protein